MDLPLPSSGGAVFEPRYLQLFRDVLREHPDGGKGGRFVHILSPSAAPPALLEDAVGGLPRIGCCAEVQSIQVGLALGYWQFLRCLPDKPQQRRSCAGRSPQRELACCTLFIFYFYYSFIFIFLICFSLYRSVRTAP